MSRVRQREIHARRVRKLKVRRLRGKAAEAKTSTQKEQLASKLGRLAPWLSMEEFMAPTKKKS